jgi:hypothetical protein
MSNQSPNRVVKSERLRAGLDTARRVWVTSEGVEFALRPIRALIVERIVNDTHGKPEVPMIEVLIGGKNKRLEPNPGDADYQARLVEWQKAKNFNLTFYLFTAGIQGSPPKAFVEEYLAYFPEADALKLKYLWVASQMPDAELESAMEAIMGQNETTQKGLSDAADSFRSEDQRQPD